MMDYTGDKGAGGCGGAAGSCGSGASGEEWIREVYYRRDFMIRLDFRNRRGEACGKPEYDFGLEFRTRRMTGIYEAWQRDGRLHNIVLDAEGRPWAVLSGHRLGTGELRMRLRAAVEDSRYAGGIRREESEIETGIYLTDGPAVDADLSVEVGLPCGFDGSGWSKSCGCAGETEGNYEPATDEEVSRMLGELL